MSLLPCANSRSAPLEPGVENMLGHAPAPLTAEAVWTCAPATRRKPGEPSRSRFSSPGAVLQRYLSNLSHSALLRNMNSSPVPVSITAH
jgi:hypothetical protein